MRASASVVPLALLLAACGSAPRRADDSAGARIETAAVDAGLIGDPAKANLTGSWARDTDRLCILPASRDRLRIGVLVDYGEGQGCAASGTARRRGATVAVDFGACRFDAAFDGERIVFPAELPAACDRLCTGRASLAALSVEHLGPSASEAETLRSPAGKLLCPMGQ